MAGRLNDVIDATVIALALPQIMQPEEVFHIRPSLGAGNDTGRRYDIETSHRVAELTVALWRGADAMRKRTTFADLVALTLDESGRKAQLYVVGEEPIRFLRISKAMAGWALDRSSLKPRERFDDKLGDLSVPIREFTAGPAGAVELIDLTTLLPFLAGRPKEATSSH